MSKHKAVVLLKVNSKVVNRSVRMDLRQDQQYGSSSRAGVLGSNGRSNKAGRFWNVMDRTREGSELSGNEGRPSSNGGKDSSQYAIVKW